jgi:hypothetical protein
MMDNVNNVMNDPLQPQDSLHENQGKFSDPGWDLLGTINYRYKNSNKLQSWTKKIPKQRKRKEYTI